MASHRRAVTVFAVVLVFVATCTTPASAATWWFETLDGIGGANGRVDADVANDTTTIVWSNQPHVFYHDNTTGDLRHAWWTGTEWFFETLDGDGGANGRISGFVGQGPRATVWSNQPHVFYQDAVGEDLRHAWWTGTEWFFETLDGHQNGPNGQLVSTVNVQFSVQIWSGEPHVWYQGGTDRDLRHAWWNGQAWFFETLDGNSISGNRINGFVGEHSDATVFNNEPHVWYYDRSNRDLRHAWWNGQAWFFETLDGDSSVGGRVLNTVGIDNAVRVVGNEPHVWYHDETGGNLRHAWWSGTTWNFETLDGHLNDLNGRVNAIVGFDSSVVLWRGRPHVYYFNFTTDDLRQAWWTGSTWRFETLDGNSILNGRVNGAVGRAASTVFWNNQLHVWYQDFSAGGNGNLRHAWYG